MVTRIGPSKPFRHFIAERREKASLTQEQLANRMETTKATISRWEAYERDPPMKSLAALAEALDIEIEELFIDPARPSADALLKMSSDKTRKLALKLVKDVIEDAKKDGTNG
jgi:transcriptional regulator with XRE-family HTH domain